MCALCCQRVYCRLGHLEKKTDQRGFDSKTWRRFHCSYMFHSSYMCCVYWSIKCLLVKCVCVHKRQRLLIIWLSSANTVPGEAFCKWHSVSPITPHSPPRLSSDSTLTTRSQQLLSVCMQRHGYPVALGFKQSHTKQLDAVPRGHETRQIASRWR